MRNIRLMHLAIQLLKGCEHPDIKDVQFFDIDKVSPAGIKVLMNNGTSVNLRVVGTYPPKGDDHSQPEELRYPNYQIPEEIYENVPHLRTIRRR